MKAITVISLAAHAFPAAVSAFCCPVHMLNPIFFLPGWCHDTTQGTPCCATGKCNLFCCACEGKCRDLYDYDDDPPFKNSTNSTAAAADVVVDRPVWNDLGAEEFGLADVEEHGNLTFEEYARHMGIAEEQPQIWIDWFHQHDRNGDGVITPDEVDTV